MSMSPCGGRLSAGPGTLRAERDAHSDNGGCVHSKGLFRCTADFLYPAGLAVVISLSVHLPCRSGPFGGGREQP